MDNLFIHIFWDLLTLNTGRLNERSGTLEGSNLVSVSDGLGSTGVNTLTFFLRSSRSSFSDSRDRLLELFLLNTQIIQDICYRKKLSNHLKSWCLCLWITKNIHCTGSMGNYSVGDYFVSLLCKTIYYFVISLYWPKFVDMDDLWNPWTLLPHY